jgi:hypothetical protein
LQDKAAQDFALQQGTLLDKAFEMLLSDQQREINAVRDKYFAILQLDELSVEQRVALENKAAEEIKAIKKKQKMQKTQLKNLNLMLKLLQ